MEKTIEIAYQAGAGFVRMTAWGIQIDVMRSVWKRLVTNNGFADPKGSHGYITLPGECFKDILRYSRNVVGNRKRINRLMSQAHVRLDTIPPIHRIEGQYTLEEEQTEWKTYEEFRGMVDPMVARFQKHLLDIASGLDSKEVERTLDIEIENLYVDYRDGYVNDIERRFHARWRENVLVLANQKHVVLQ